MLQLVEMIGRMNEKGCIEVPVVLMEQTGIRTEDEVRLLYIAAGENDFRNEAKEFLISRADNDSGEKILNDTNVELKLPPELFKDANIPMDANLDIVCMDKKIVILPADDPEMEIVPPELMEIFDELGIPKDKVSVILRAMEE
ncbi:MAG: hypothetical protein J6B94_00595 [Lachnospiraceae bacterium]|nr:hypothetical protein [Lachnospiraceae bacterium]